MERNSFALTVYGAGGFARQIIPLLEERDSAGSCFIDESGPEGHLCGFPVRRSSDDHDRPFVVAISSGATRRSLGERLEAAGATPARLIANSARISRHAKIGRGAVICDFSVIEPFVTIGAHFHANVRVFVAHESIIGDYVTFGPGAICNGNVHIGDGVYIGAGALIRQGTSRKPLKIGAGAIIGMGAVVTKDVGEGVTIVGNPTRQLAPASGAKPVRVS